MTFLISAALVGWLPLCLLLFMVLPPHRAVIVGVVGGWIVLPPSSIPLPGLPDYDKGMAPVIGVALGTLIFQPNRLLAFRPRWFDLPALLWTFCPLCSSLANGLGVYDGLSGMLGHLVRWALPYLIGRLYFGSKEEMRELAAGIAIGGMVLVLPCLFEMRMSPVLLLKVYGIGNFEGLRLGGWRPRIFFATGLELGMWMTASSLTAAWLWWTGSLKRLRAYPLFTWMLPVLMMTAMFCRASGALFLLIAGVSILLASTRFKTSLLLYLLLLVPPLYYLVRIPNYWSGSELTQLFSTYFNKDRAESLAFRFDKENLLAQRAMLQPIWGWAGWGRNRVTDAETGRDIAPTDGMWIIYLGMYGCAGLLTWTTMMLLPSWLFTLRFPARLWRDPAVAPMAVMATLLGLYLVDCLVNGFLNLSYVIASGGLAGAVQSAGSTPRSQRRSGSKRQLAHTQGPAASIHQVEDVSPQSAERSIASREPCTSAVTPQQRLAERYTQLSKTLRTQGQPGEAKAMLTHALQLLNTLQKTGFDTPGVQEQRRNCTNDLAWLIISQPDPSKSDLDLAVELARQTAAASPDSAAYLTTLGAALFCIGESSDSIDVLERSVATGDGGTGFDYVFLALAHNKLGQADQSRHWLNRAESWLQSQRGCPSELLCFLNQARKQDQSDRQPLVS